jgi:DNA-binding FadR family transcriptional regulator
VAQTPRKNATSLRRIRQTPSLVTEIVRRVAADIASGKFAPGARLPTEQAMMEMTGVSRTVVREAVAALRAEGLVTTRQGVGAFVAEAPSLAPFRIEAGQEASVVEVVHIMELRGAVETEAAGLAAERARPAQLRAIRAAMSAIDAAIARGEDAVPEDFAFHAAIADATGNPQFRRFLDFIGRFVIPRGRVRVPADNLPAYLTTFQAEHRTIVAAIEARSPARAQTAMRTHLVRSRERYRDLVKR